MKKYFALLLAFLLALAPLTAAESEPTLTPSPAPTPKPEVFSEIQRSFEPPRCKAAVLMDAETGEILYDFHGSDHNYPASITKVMTALLTLEAIDRGELSLDTLVTASDNFDEDLSADGSTQGIKPGEELTVEQLLYCALVPSANEACNILAQTVAGDIPTFVEKMNARAQALGMVNTQYVNAHGLHNANHYTTAHDVALLVQEALKNKTFATIVSTKVYSIPATNLSPKRMFGNTNALITPSHFPGYTYAKAIGVKTGSTTEAGQCLASAAVNGEKTLICVVLGAENVKNEDGTITRYAFAESKRLLEWGFDSFARRELIDTHTPVKEIPVTLSADMTSVALKPAEGIRVTLYKDLDPNDFQHDITLYCDSVEAPVEAGQELGELTVRNGDTVYGTVKLVAVATAQRSDLLYNLQRAKDFFAQTWVKVGLIALGALILLLALRFAVFGKRKRSRYGHRAQTPRNYTGRKRR